VTLLSEAPPIQLAQRGGGGIERKSAERFATGIRNACWRGDIKGDEEGVRRGNAGIKIRNRSSPGERGESIT